MPRSSATIDRAIAFSSDAAITPPFVGLASLSFGWNAAIRRTVPERERITSDSVSTPLALARTPWSSEPPVTPVAATKTSSPATRSSAESTRSRSKPASSSAVSLAVVARPESALDRAAEALDRGRRDDALRRPADAHQHVDAGPRPARGDRGRDVTVADQVHARARVAQLRDQLVVALALEHHDREVAHLHALGRRHRLHVLGRRQAEVDRVGGLGADRDLLHVEGRAREEHRAALGDRDHRDRSRGCRAQ